MAKEDPVELLRRMSQREFTDVDLSYAAEFVAGEGFPAISVIVGLIDHPSPIVREGSVKACGILLGSGHGGDELIDDLRERAKVESDKGILADIIHAIDCF